MTRYFFHVANGSSDLDHEGIELPDDQAARVEALHFMGELLRDRGPDVWDAQGMKLIVTDKSGLILFVLALSAVEAPALRRRA